MQSSGGLADAARAGANAATTVLSGPAGGAAGAAWAAAAPPAGPLRTVSAACADAVSTSARPPLDCMIAGSGSAASRAPCTRRRR